MVNSLLQRNINAIFYGVTHNYNHLPTPSILYLEFKSQNGCIECCVQAIQVRMCIESACSLAAAGMGAGRGAVTAGATCTAAKPASKQLLFSSALTTVYAHCACCLLLCLWVSVDPIQ